MDYEKEIPFGAFDSELMHQEIYIPEGFEATIDGNKIILKKTESEDEKVRNEIKDIFYSLGEGKIPVSINFAAIFDWLENQGEQNHFEQDLEMEIKQNFKIGDWITDGYLYNKITDVLDDRYIVDTKFAKRSSIPFKFENYYHLWTTKDAKDGDVLVHNDCTFIFMGIKDGIVQALEENLLEGTNPVPFGEPNKDKDYHPATKEQRDLLFQKMREAGYEWDAEKKELKLLITNGGDFESENCEQKPDDMTESKFNVGDWVIYKNDICQIVKREEGCNKLVTTFGIEKELVNERNLSTARLWTIADAKKGDILADKYGVYIYGQLDILDESACVSICGYQYSDKKFEPESMICNKSDFYPATKEQRDTLFTKMHEAGYMWDSKSKQLLSLKAEPRGEQKPAWSWSEEDEKILDGIIYHFSKGHTSTIGQDAWLKTLKDRAQPQPKQEWSEEDENAIKVLMNIIRKSEIIDSIIYTDSLKEKLYNWLKSLKDRYTWKPSDTQMGALLSKLPAIKGSGYEIQCVLETLYDDLKKLKGE